MVQHTINMTDEYIQISRLQIENKLVGSASVNKLKYSNTTNRSNEHKINLFSVLICQRECYHSYLSPWPCLMHIEFPACHLGTLSSQCHQDTGDTDREVIKYFKYNQRKLRDNHPTLYSFVWNSFCPFASWMVQSPLGKIFCTEPFGNTLSSSPFG